MGQLKNLSTTVRLTVANLSSENKSAFGPGIAKLCLGVREMGSLNAAAKGHAHGLQQGLAHHQRH